jgi:hypothetical protein
VDNYEDIFGLSGIFPCFPPFFGDCLKIERTFNALIFNVSFCDTGQGSENKGTFVTGL